MLDKKIMLGKELNIKGVDDEREQFLEEASIKIQNHNDVQRDVPDLVVVVWDPGELLCGNIDMDSIMVDDLELTECAPSKSLLLFENFQINNELWKV